MAYQATIYPNDGADAIEVKTSNIMFVNEESYGTPTALGHTGDDTTFVNLAYAVVVEVTDVD